MRLPAHATATINFFQYDQAFEHARDLVEPDTAIMCVVKANAYGLGVEPVARRALQNGAEFLAVAYLSEAIELRNLSIIAKILVFTEPEPSEYAEFIAHQLTATIYTPETAQGLAAACLQAGKSLDVHINVDTGMSRLGCLPETVPTLMSILSGSPCIRLSGLFSHFACSDDVNSPKNQQQLTRFNEVVKSASAQHRFDWIHMANSAGILNYPDAKFNMVRMGILTYINCVQLESSIGAIRHLKAGETVSYNATYACQTDTRIATIPIGYADGIPISASNKIEVEINGKRYPQVGRVTMDSLMVDIGSTDAISIGNTVVFFGPNSTISLADFATQCGTIPYEILCRMGSRVTRVYE